MVQELNRVTMDDVLAAAGNVMEYKRQLNEAKGRQSSAKKALESADREVAEAQAKVDAAETKFVNTFKEMK